VRAASSAGLHKIANVLDALPKRLQARAKTLLHEMMQAPTEQAPAKCWARSGSSSRPSTPKGSGQARSRLEALDGVLRVPGRALAPPQDDEPDRDSFATVKLRTRVTKGAGSKAPALGMAFKLLKTAEERWRRFNGHELVADVLAGATFKDGIRVPAEHPTHDEKVPPDHLHAHLIHNS